MEQAKRKKPEPRKNRKKVAKLEINEKLLNEAKLLASRGLTNEEIAYNLDIGRSTLYENMMKHPDLADAIRKGKASGVAQIANKLYQKASGGDTTCMIFYLKCRGGWRDVQQIETIDRTGEIQTFDEKDPIEASKKYQELMG